MGVVTHLGDAVKWAQEKARETGPIFHALLCDSPYEMDFMGKGWDGSGVAFDPDTWEAFAGVLYPGAFLFVFAGTINDDLISVAMRKAGLRKFHKMMGWAYGSGFPKASRIDTQIDKAAGAEREIVGYKRGKGGENLNNLSRLNGKDNKSARGMGAYGQGARQIDIDIPIEAPSTPLAQAWEGHRYGLQALKPAIETILIFQKPYEGKPIDDIAETGAGALNIDGGRIGTDEQGSRNHNGKVYNNVADGYKRPNASMYQHKTDWEMQPSGRWPSNFLLLDEGAARALDEQSGITSSGATKRNISGYEGESITGFLRGESNPGNQHGDSGGASRFFFRVSEQIDEADPVFYSAKASRGERDAGLEGLEESDSAVQNTSGRRFNPICDHTGKRIQNCKCGSCEWSKSTNPRVRNPHPTVKPLSLTQYLATLLLPPIEYAPRRLFVPFAGSGSEQIGAILAGWEEVEGVELTEEYIPINRARVEYWQKRPRGAKKPKNKIPENVKDPNQMELI